jgi:hypothetical protein
VIRRVLAALLMLATAAGPAGGAWAQSQQAPPGATQQVPGLDKLPPDERAVAERNLERWRAMPPE